VLVSTGNDWSGYITEGKEVYEWIGIGSSLIEVMEFVEYSYVVVETRTQWSSLQDEEFKYGSSQY
jgi:tRNA G10  N-methylase Trm11